MSERRIEDRDALYDVLDELTASVTDESRAWATYRCDGCGALVPLSYPPLNDETPVVISAVCPEQFGGCGAQTIHDLVREPEEADAGLAVDVRDQLQTLVAQVVLYPVVAFISLAATAEMLSRTGDAAMSVSAGLGIGIAGGWAVYAWGGA